MKKQTLAKDIMVTKLVTLTPETDLLEAIGKLLDNKISGAPVVDKEKRFLGVLSERCGLRAVMHAAYHEVPSDTVSAFMDPECTTISEDTAIIEAEILGIVDTFAKTGARRLPVLRGDKLVGQISRRDVLRYTLEQLEKRPDPEKPKLLYLSALFDSGDSPIA